MVWWQASVHLLPHQARAAALMRQNMEVQQRQSSLERRAVYQKSLIAARSDHMQVHVML